MVQKVNTGFTPVPPEAIHDNKGRVGHWGLGDTQTGDGEEGEGWLKGRGLKTGNYRCLTGQTKGGKVPGLTKGRSRV